MSQPKIFQPIVAPTRLRALELDTELLAEVVLRGEYARAEATDHDPIAAGPLDACRYRVRALRDRLVPRGWTIDRESGVAMTRSPCGGRVVLTRGGDEGVGRESAFPQPRRPAGRGTRGLVGEQLPLLADWAEPALASNSADEVWMLLVARDGDRVRSELSRPSSIGEDGDVCGWLERILLAEIDCSEPVGRPTVAEPEVIDVPVIRKR